MKSLVEDLGERGSEIQRSQRMFCSMLHGFVLKESTKLTKRGKPLVFWSISKPPALEDKEARINEVMKMMGMSSEAILLGWYVTWS